MTTQPPDQRADPRIKVNFAGTLMNGGNALPCQIQNMCSRGFLIKATEGLPVGHNLRLKVELYPAQPVDCTVQVRHVNRDCLGARVIEINDEGRRLCQRYLEEHRTA